MSADGLGVLPATVIDDEAEVDAFLRHGGGSAGAQRVPGIFRGIQLYTLGEFFDGAGHNARVYADVFRRRAVIAEQWAFCRPGGGNIGLERGHRAYLLI